MKQPELQGMNQDQLEKRFRALRRAYDEACLAYDTAKSRSLHQEIRVVEKEMMARSGGVQDFDAIKLLKFAAS